MGKRCFQVQTSELGHHGRPQTFRAFKCIGWEITTGVVSERSKTSGNLKISISALYLFDFFLGKYTTTLIKKTSTTKEKYNLGIAD